MTTSRTWNGPAAILEALVTLVQPDTSHAHYPTGGGMDWRAIDHTEESDCLALSLEERIADVFRPERMAIEHFPDGPQ